MPQKRLASLAIALGLVGSAYAQVPPPTPEAAPSMLPAPAVRTSNPPTTLSPTETTAKSLVGAKIFAPRAGTPAAATPSRATEPSAGGSTPAGMAAASRNTIIPAITDAEWTALRENHDNIGDVGNLILNNNGQVHQIVLGVGGFLGVGEKAVAIDWADITWMRFSDGKLFGIVHRTRQQLEAAPRFVDRS